MVPTDAATAAAAGAAAPAAGAATPSADELIAKFQLLHLVAEALAHIAAADDPATVTPSIARLHARVAECAALLDGLPGGAMTRAEQLAEIDRLRGALQRKRALVRRFAKHDLVARVLVQRAIPGNQTDGGAQPGLPDDLAVATAAAAAAAAVGAGAGQPAAGVAVPPVPPGVDPQKALQPGAPAVSADADADADAMRMDDSFGEGDYSFMGKM